MELSAGRIPEEITRVRGCTCGGTTLHRASEPRCPFLDINEAEAVAALDEAQARIQEYIDWKNQMLRSTRERIAWGEWA